MADTLMYVDSNSPYICHRRNSSFTQTKGLLNRPGQNNCFLNSAVQVLWHLDIFRSSFRETINHTCVGDMCIFCALKELFTQFQYSGDAALPPDALRKALAQTFINQQRFQLGYMDDAAECFENILTRIHFHITNGEAEDMCNDVKCIPHQKFAMTLVEQGMCHSCGATSEPLPFTQMVHYISSSTLCAQERIQRDMTVERFGQLLRRASEVGDVKECPSGCGGKIQIQKSLMNHPEIISIGIAWDSERPTLDHIMDVFSTIGTAIQLQDVFHSVVDRKWASAVRHHLVGVVTYYGKHYSTFFFHTKLRMWIYFDDATVRQIGPCWEHVVDKCRRGHFQPLLLLYANLDAVPTTTNGFGINKGLSQTVDNPQRAPSAGLYPTQQQRPCLTPDQQVQKLHLHPNGYDLDSDTGYSSADRSPNGVKHPYETGYDYYKANGRNFRYPPNEPVQDKKLDSKIGPPTHFNFQFDEVDAAYHKLNELNAPPAMSSYYPNRGNGHHPSHGGDGAYISRKAVENILNYQKVRQMAGPQSQTQNTRNDPCGHHQDNGPQRYSDHINAYYQQERPCLSDYNAARNLQPRPDISVPSMSGAVNGFQAHSKMPTHVTSKGPYDAGYDSFSLSSNDSFPVNQRHHQHHHPSNKVADTTTLGNIPEVHSGVPMSNGVTDICQSLCWEADNYLKQSVDHENVGDIETAINLCHGAAAKARAAMDAPYSNPHSLVLAQRKHNTCIMRARSLHRRILARQDSINSYSSSTGTETDTMLDTVSINSGSNVSRTVYHSRQSSRDSTYRRSLGNHSRQSSRDRSNGPSPAGQVCHGRQNSQDSMTAEKKRIEVYATLPKSVAKKKSVIKNIFPNMKTEVPKMAGSGPISLAIKDDTFWKSERADEDHTNGYLSSCESQTQVTKKTNPLCRTNSIPPKLYNVGSTTVSTQEQQRLDEERMAAKVEKNKQHRVRRKCLMGGLLRRKNNSMPDLREDLVPSNGTAGDLKAFEEGISPAKSEQNLTDNRTGVRNTRIPPPPPVRTTSQLSIRSQSHGNLINQPVVPTMEPSYFNGYNPQPPKPVDAHPERVPTNYNVKPVVGNQVKTCQQPNRPPPPTPPEPADLDLPPPPPYMLIPNHKTCKVDTPPCKSPPESPTSLPHWLKELQTKQQQLVQRKNSGQGSDAPPSNRSSEGNCSKKMPLPLPNPYVAVTNPVLKPISPVIPHYPAPIPHEPMKLSLLNADEYKARSVRDLASKFERKLHIGPNVSVNSAVKSPTVDVSSSKLNGHSGPIDDQIRNGSQIPINWPNLKSPTNHAVDINGPKMPLYKGLSIEDNHRCGGMDQVDSVEVPFQNCPKKPDNSGQQRTQSYNDRPLTNGNWPVNASTRLDHYPDAQNVAKIKSKGPKKSVKFSDQIVLVAGAEETENLTEILQSPLFKKVLQKSLSGHVNEHSHGDTDMAGHVVEPRTEYHCQPRKAAVTQVQMMPAVTKIPCSLCHKKMTSPANVYCADCEFYMSRFKPKR